MYEKKIAQYKHTWATTGVSRQPYEGLHMFYTLKSTQTNASYPAMVISCMSSRGEVYIDLEVMQCTEKLRELIRTQILLVTRQQETGLSGILVI